MLDGTPTFQPAADKVAAAAARPITKFKAIMYPPLGPLFDHPSARSDIRAIVALLGAEVARVQAPPGDARLKAVSEQAQTRLSAEARRVADAAKPAVDAWVAAIFQDLADVHIPAKPAATAPFAYANDILYIVSTPEFALNGYENPVGSGTIAYDAWSAFHESLETYLQAAIRARLQAYDHVRIVFTFSCCTYSDILCDEYSNAGVPIPNIPRRLSCSNRISILTSSPLPAQTIMKRETSSIDGWTGAAGSRQSLFSNKVNALQAGLVRQYLNLDLACFGGTWGTQVLAFATCLDVAIDQHPGTNLVVVLGGGAPIDKMADILHPFVLNDIRSWQLGIRDVWGIGYFFYSANPPLGDHTVYQNVYAAFAAMFPDSLPLASARNCYWWKWETSQDGLRQKAWTGILDFPPKV